MYKKLYMNLDFLCFDENITFTTTNIVSKDIIIDINKYQFLFWI